MGTVAALLRGCQSNLLSKILRTQETWFSGICSYCQYLCHLCVFLYITGVCVHIFVCLPYVRIVEGGITVDIAEILLLTRRRIRAMLTHN